MRKYLLVGWSVILLSCNTYVTQPIAKLVKNDWVRTPLDFDNEQHWNFDGSILTISYSNLIGNYDYTIDNNLVKDYIHITPRDSFTSKWDTAIIRWRIIRLNKEEFYIISESKTTSGAFHRSFVLTN